MLGIAILVGGIYNHQQEMKKVCTTRLTRLKYTCVHVLVIYFIRACATKE